MVYTSRQAIPCADSALVSIRRDGVRGGGTAGQHSIAGRTDGQAHTIQGTAGGRERQRSRGAGAGAGAVYRRGAAGVGVGRGASVVRQA